MYQKIILAVFTVLLFSSANFGQSCGGGKSIFHIFDESGSIEIKTASIALHTVSEEQDWKLKDFSDRNWKLQDFDEETKAKYSKKPKEHLESAYEIPFSEYKLLMEDRRKIIEENPKSVVAEKDLNGSIQQNLTAAQNNIFSVSTREGCSFMVAAEIQAEGYETAYFVSDFNCGCTKHYEFKLRKKSETNLPPESKKMSE